jgi:hypothetical protein
MLMQTGERFIGKITKLALILVQMEMDSFEVSFQLVFGPESFG